jgi:hypothetical protein
MDFIFLYWLTVGIPQFAVVMIPILFYMLMDLWYTLEGMAFEREPKYRLVPLILIQRWVYRYVVAYVIVRGLIIALIGSFVRWGKARRRGDLLSPSLVPAEAS